MKNRKKKYPFLELRINNNVKNLNLVVFLVASGNNFNVVAILTSFLVVFWWFFLTRLSKDWTHSSHNIKINEKENFEFNKVNTILNEFVVKRALNNYLVFLNTYILVNE